MEIGYNNIDLWFFIKLNFYIKIAKSDDVKKCLMNVVKSEKCIFTVELNCKLSIKNEENDTKLWGIKNKTTFWNHFNESQCNQEHVWKKSSTEMRTTIEYKRFYFDNLFALHSNSLHLFTLHKAFFVGKYFRKKNVGFPSWIDKPFF